MRHLMRELKVFRTSSPEDICIQLNEESVLDVVGIIEGPGEFYSLHPRPLVDTSLQRVPHTTKGTPA